MSNYTTEQWYRAQSIHNYEDVKQCYIYGGKNVIAVRVCLRDDDKSDPADANRDTTDHITKCVNACAGINPEAVPEMLRLAQMVRSLNENHLEIGAGRMLEMVTVARNALTKAEANQ